MVLKFNNNGLSKKLNQIANAAKKMQEEKSVPLVDLFNPQFMKQYSQFQSFGDFADKSNCDFSNFKSIDEAKLDSFIAKTTSFSSWQEMKSKAVKDLVLKKLKN